MMMNGVFQRCLDWFFPLQREAERKSTQAIDKLDTLILEVRQVRTEAMFSRHEEFSCDPRGADLPRKDETYVLD